MNMKREQWVWLGLMLGGPSVVVFMLQLLLVRTPLLTPLSSDLAHSFLGTMAQVLAGILAIVFSVSVLAVEITSDRYTPRLFSYFRDNPATWLALVSLLACTLLSVVAIGVQAIPMYQLGFLAMSWFFVFCLLTMVYYFRQTLWLLDPRNLAEEIRDEGLQALKKRETKKALDAITSLGDVAVKVFERGEDEITQKYLDMLQEIQLAFITTGSTPMPTTDHGIASYLFLLSITSPIVKEYYRIFKTATEKNNEGLTQYVARLLSATIVTLIEQGGSKQILKGILLQQYQEFIKIAVKNRDISRFKLVHSFREAIFPRSYAQAFNEEYLPICLGALKQANKAIIDHKDFELWKEELNHFSRILSVEEVYDLLHSDLRKLLHDLARAGISISEEQWERWNTMVRPTRTRITPTNKRVFELEMSGIEQLIPASEQELQEQAQKVREALRRLWITAGVYDAFFGICVYAFYRHRYGYIKELWRFVNPSDANVYWGNANLIHPNIGFLTHQMVAFLSIPWEIEGYHGAEEYVLKYYLLCLAYALYQTKSDWHPTVPHFTKAMLSRGDKYSVAMGQELGATHTFLVNLPYYADKVLAQYEAVASTIEEWDDVFDGQASDALEKARNSLADEERRQEWKGRAESIIGNLPLDGDRVDAYKKAALEYYQSRSQVNQLAVTENNGERVPTKLAGSCRIQCPDKRNFTLIDLGKPQDIGTRVGFEAMHQIATAEVANIAKTILEHKEAKPFRVKQLTFNKVAKAVKRIGEAGCQATVLLAPRRQIGSAWQDDSQFRAHMAYGEGDERYLILDKSTKLRILETDGDYAFVLDRSAGNWTTVKPLEIEVTDCDKNPLAVQIIAHEVISYRVLNPQAVEILKFRSPRKKVHG